MKPLDLKRQEAAERQAQHDSLSVEEQLRKALERSGGKKTREVKRLEAKRDKLKKAA